MEIKTLMQVDAPIDALDMLGNEMRGFTPFSLRGPNIVQLNDGTLVFLFEMKIGSQLDEAEGVKAVMRSHDDGKTWGDLRLLTYPGCPINVPCGAMLYDALQDSLLVFSRLRHWKEGHEQVRPMTEEDQINGHSYETFYITKSRDGGLSWSRFEEVPVTGIPADWTVQSCPTAGVGIQLRRQSDPAHNGRLLLPANHASMNNGQNEFRAHILLSDDFGKSWRMGAIEQYLGSNESMAVELLDGTIVYNCRNQGGQPEHQRIQSYSYDGGETLQNAATVPTLYDPLCHAGFATLCIAGREYIFASAPTGAPCNPSFFMGHTIRWGVREALTLYASADGGKTYRAIKQLSPHGEFAAYSSLCATRDGGLICAWESGPQIGCYRSIKYVILTSDELAKMCESL